MCKLAHVSIKRHGVKRMWDWRRSAMHSEPRPYIEVSDYF